MADRIVVLGWGGEAIELFSAMDASAFVDGGMLRASMALWSGPLADATVLQPTVKYLRDHGGENEEGYTHAFRSIRRLVRESDRCDLELETPIPLAGHAAALARG